MSPMLNSAKNSAPCSWSLSKRDVSQRHGEADATHIKTREGHHAVSYDHCSKDANHRVPHLEIPSTIRLIDTAVSTGTIASKMRATPNAAIPAHKRWRYDGGTNGCAIAPQICSIVISEFPVSIRSLVSELHHRLKSGVIWHPWEWNRVADVFHTSDV